VAGGAKNENGLKRELLLATAAQFLDARSFQARFAGIGAEAASLRSKYGWGWDVSGGRCEIRTHGAVAGTPVFKTGALDRSANLPACSPLPPVLVST
jgi:hypothetical protein